MQEGYSLRPYQQTALNFTTDILYEQNKPSVIVVLPTGLGKTILIAAIVEKELERGGRVLLLAHRNKLLEQAHDKIKNAIGVDAAYEGKTGGDDRIMICSIQSMSRENRLFSYDPAYFTMIIVDETHHIASPSYRKVTDYYNSAKLVGVTATPVRGDGHDTREDFAAVTPEYGTFEAIHDGFLTPVSVMKIPMSIDISRVHMQGGDYSASDVGLVLISYLERIAEKTAELTKGKKTVIFTPLVRTAVSLAEIFNTKTDMRADYVSGDRADSDEVIDLFEKGELDIIINAMLLTEGWDCPSVDCVINLRPTKSKGLYIQMIGRSLRLFPGKDRACILDFLWQDNGRGHLNAQDALIGSDDPFLRKAMEEELENGEEIDILELRERAEKRAIDEREAALADALERANALAEQMNAEQKALFDALSSYAMKKAREENISPLSVYGVIRRSDKVIVKYHCMSASIVAVRIRDSVLKDFGLDLYESMLGREWEGELPTMKQLSLLEKFGIPVGYAVNKGHASFLLEGLLERGRENLGTYKQVSALKKMGYMDAETWSKKDCKAALDKKFRKRSG